MPTCAFCGRANDSTSRFCTDCGKPTPDGHTPVATAGAAEPAAYTAAAVAGGPALPLIVPPTRVAPASRGTPPVPMAPCPHCTALVDATMPFCSHCGRRLAREAVSGPACAACGAPVRAGEDLFCARCGAAVAPEAASAGGATGAGNGASAGGATVALSAAARDVRPRVALLDDVGDAAHIYVMERDELMVGRVDGDIRFPEDVYLSPIHALFALRDGALWLRDLGSRNSTWVFIDNPFRLTDGDVVLVGSQLLRFRRLGYPGPHPPEADATRRLGSLVPSADVAVLQQLRGDGSVRDTLHLSPGRAVSLGRDHGDWVFPYDQTMSGRHAEVRSDDSEFVVHDLGSRNGVALAVRGERKLERGQRVLVGDQILRVEHV